MVSTVVRQGVPSSPESRQDSYAREFFDAQTGRLRDAATDDDQTALQAEIEESHPALPRYLLAYAAGSKEGSDALFYLLDTAAFPDEERNAAIVMAYQNGNMQAYNRLLENYTPSQATWDELLVVAAGREDDFGMVQHLLGAHTFSAPVLTEAFAGSLNSRGVITKTGFLLLNQPGLPRENVFCVMGKRFSQDDQGIVNAMVVAAGGKVFTSMPDDCGLSAQKLEQ